MNWILSDGSFGKRTLISVCSWFIMSEVSEYIMPYENDWDIVCFISEKVWLFSSEHIVIKVNGLVKEDNVGKGEQWRHENRLFIM